MHGRQCHGDNRKAFHVIGHGFSNLQPRGFGFRSQIAEGILPRNTPGNGFKNRTEPAAFGFGFVGGFQAFADFVREPFFLILQRLRLAFDGEPFFAGFVVTLQKCGG